VRGRWRPGVVVFVYYLLAVVLVENILVNTVHRQTDPLSDDYDVVALDKNNLSPTDSQDVKTPVPTTTATATCA